MIERKPGDKVRFNMPGHRDHGKRGVIVRELKSRKLWGGTMYTVKCDDRAEPYVVGNWEIVTDLEQENTE